MKTIFCLLVLSLFLVLRFYAVGGFTFPSILDDTRQAIMKFSKTTPVSPAKTLINLICNNCFKDKT
jgi:hypothetical protein